MATQFSVCPEDREKFGIPEWVTFDKDALDDVPFDELDPWDQEMKDTLGASINTFLAKEFLEATARAIKGIVWLAAKLDGVDGLKLAELNIKTRKVRMRAVRPADADPPDLDSSSSSSAESPSEPE